MAFIAFLSAVVLAWPQTIAPPRDAASRLPAPAAEGSATIRGRITDRETGRPVPRSVVRLAFLGPGTQQWHAIADDDGSYVFAKLPAGSYNLYAEPPERTSVYLSRRHGQSERADPQRNSDLTSGITLASGEATTADIALSEALTIEGRVLGDHGEPLANIRRDAPLGGQGHQVSRRRRVREVGRVQEQQRRERSRRRAHQPRRVGVGPGRVAR